MVIFAVLLFMQGSPIVPPQPVTVRNEITVNVEAPPPDPVAISQASTQSFQAIIVSLAAPTLVSWVDGLLNTPDFARTTPPDLTYNHPAVRNLADQVRLVAGALIALAVFALGLSHALSQHPPFGRLLFAVLLMVGDLAWWQIGIDINNAINAGVAAPPMVDLIRPHLALPAITADPIAAFGPAVMVIVYALVALMLLISLAFRLALIDILIAIGPLALLCAATEQTQGLYQRYTSLAVGTLFSQVLIVVCLRLAPVIGALGTGVAGSILGIVVLLLARRMPNLLSSADRGGSGAPMKAMLVLRRLVLRH